MGCMSHLRCVPRLASPAEYSILNEATCTIRFLGVWLNESLLKIVKVVKTEGERGKKENQKIGRVFNTRFLMCFSQCHKLLAKQ